MNVLYALALVALGMGIDVVYQLRIRIAECDAYETGYEQGLKENTIRKEITVPDIPAYPGYDEYKHTPTMTAPVCMPPTFEERLRKHGRAVAKLK